MNSRQQNILDFIIEFINRYQVPPTVREICEGVGAKSTSTVSTDLKVLQDEGYIKRRSQKSRSIEIVKDAFSFEATKEETIDVPVLGSVAAGVPIFADENIDYFFPVPKYFEKQGELFMLVVSGDSMIEAGILNGDRILVRRQNTADNGDIVVALIDDSATVKTFFKEKGLVKLIPHNSSMDPIIPDKLDILGKVIALYRDNF